MGASVTEHFVRFIDVKDTTGKGLCDTLFERLAMLNLNLADCVDSLMTMAVT